LLAMSYTARYFLIVRSDVYTVDPDTMAIVQ
jgi:hypothetical protein